MYKFGLTAAETNSINSDEIVQSVSSYSGPSCEHRALLIGLCSVFVFVSPGGTEKVSTFSGNQNI